MLIKTHDLYLALQHAQVSVSAGKSLHCLSSLMMEPICLKRSTSAAFMAITLPAMQYATFVEAECTLLQLHSLKTGSMIASLFFQ
jgi:hypothetical protein